MELPVHSASSANSAVKRVLNQENAYCVSHRKTNTQQFSVTTGNAAKAGKYAVQDRVGRTRKHFKPLNLSKSTVCRFKKMYVA